MVQNRAVVEAVFNVTEAIRNAADAAIPKTSNSPRKLCKPWWNASCQQAKKEQRRAWGIFRRYPTTDNLIAFKRAKALARRIRRQCQRESWIQYVSSITSSTTSQQLWRKATKNRLERTPINFRCRQPLPYNCDFDMFELKRALSSAHNTSPGPDGISYELLRHLSADSLVLSNTSWGADRTSLLRVYQAIVLSRIDYGCVAYGSACNSTLQKLDPVHHMALRICSGAFRTSPVQSLYVNCHQLPLDLRRRKLSLAYYFKILSVPSHPLQNVYMSTSMKRLYDARPSNIRPFMDRMKLHISELDLPNVRIQQKNLFLFQPWNTPRFPYINPFATYSKSTVAPVVFQRVFAYHRSQYSRYSAIYTDGSKRADYVGCGVVIEDIMHGYRLDTSCSIFTAEAVAIYRALQLIDSTMPPNTAFILTA
ncbi:RNase H domain-containing protein [Trichonephila clavipes]|nr:RNase H domain-containing protein [Trichonephila clavipes]